MLYVLIPIYNEEANIPNLAKELKNALVPFEHKFVFSDDGSSDQTVDVLKSHFEPESIAILGDGKNYGPGHAFNVGFDWILEASSAENDLILSIEADCTSDVSIIPEMITLANMRYDLVLASVYAQGGGFDKTTFFRRLISSLANLFFRFAFNVKVLTLSSFYRVYRVSKVRQVKEQFGVVIKERGFICMLEILLKMIRAEARIIEVPVTLASAKRAGKSKMKIVKTTMQYLRFLFTFKGK